MRRLTPVVLRTVALTALVLLMWNPGCTRDAPAGTPPLVLLDASLSMAEPARWSAARDSARAASGGAGGVVWRFGGRVAAFDTAPPGDGTSRLGPALAAAAGRGGPITIVTDGEMDDVAGIPPDLLRLPRVVLLPRPSARDAFVAFVDGPARVAATDTVRLRVGYGVAGSGEARAGPRAATLTVSLGGRRVTSRRVTLPDSGVVVTELAHPASRLPAGFSALEVRLDSLRDGEARDDARLLVVEVSPDPAAVVLAAPPSWETRFLTIVLEDVARIPLRAFVQLGDTGGGWRDARTLAPVALGDVARAVRGAQLVVHGGAVPPGVALPPGTAVLAAPAGATNAGDWYVRPPGPSPIAGQLAGIDWDALAPATALDDIVQHATDAAALSVTLARRGPARSAVVLAEDGRRRRATIAAAGLWRWQFRGGASAVAYRALVAALVDWLLGGEGTAGKHEAVPEARVVPNGVALGWRWTGRGDPRDLPMRLDSGDGVRTDTLRFDAAGRAELRLVPGVYRYALAGGGGVPRGMVAVEVYSDEWRPRAVAIAAQAGAPSGRSIAVGMRDRWWLFLVAVAALIAEWGWRRRQGLP